MNEMKNNICLKYIPSIYYYFNQFNFIIIKGNLDYTLGISH